MPLSQPTVGSLRMSYTDDLGLRCDFNTAIVDAAQLSHTVLSCLPRINIGVGPCLENLVRTLLHADKRGILVNATVLYLPRTKEFVCQSHGVSCRSAVDASFHLSSSFSNERTYHSLETLIVMIESYCQ
eukprot:5801179-Pleurochrysis_carterae.AAC.1